jgi:hypothetical protein
MEINKNQIHYWLNKYRNEEDLEDSDTKETEEELKKRFKKNKYITKDDLIKIIKWKFQDDRLKGRQKRTLNLIKPIYPHFIENISRLAFKTENEEIRFILLNGIKGVGPSVTSVILSFYDPNNYGVLDIHSWRELFGKEPNDLFSNYKYLSKFLGKLRKLSSKFGMPCRDIEKALFKKNLDES